MNLQANPEVTVLLTDGPRAVRGRAATAEESERLWDRWRAIDDKTDAFKSLRPSETALVILEPRTP